MDKSARTEVPLHPLIADRWSPRGFDAAHALAPAQISALLEAARWAPSANNSQPWRFVVGNRGDAAFRTIAEVLNPGNALWAPAASALILVVAETTAEDGSARPFALYDTGQAVAGLVAQAGAEDLSVHQMGGFDAAAAASRFALRDGLRPLVVIAVGRHDPAAALTPALAERETAPRARREIQDLLLTLPVAA